MSVLGFRKLKTDVVSFGITVNVSTPSTYTSAYETNHFRVVPFVWRDFKIYGLSPVFTTQDGELTIISDCEAEGVRGLAPLNINKLIEDSPIFNITSYSNDDVSDWLEINTILFNTVTLKAGTYRFNDEIIIDSDLGEFNLPFTVNNLNIPDVDTTSLTCNRIKIYKEYDEEYFDYTGIIYVSTTPIEQGGITFDEVVVYINGNLYGEMLTHMWESDGFKNHTITEDTDVPEIFGTWYIANTNYNEVNGSTETPLAEITYNGETIAQLNAGETATLSCKDKKMASDVVVKVDRVIIPKGDVTFNENGSYDVANKSTAIVDVPTIIDVTELPTNPKDTDTRSIYRCNGKLYVVDEFGAGTTWRIDNTRTGTMEIDGMAYWDIPFESNGETFSNFGIYRGDSTNSFCHIDYNGSRVYTATAKSQGTWTNENYRTVRLLKNVSSGYHSLGSWLSANGERLTNVWVEYIKPEGTLELVFNNIEAEFPIDCSQYAKVTVNTAEPLKITDPTVLDNITDSPWGVGGSVFLYEGATTDSYEKDALYYLEDTEK